MQEERRERKGDNTIEVLNVNYKTKKTSVVEMVNWRVPNVD